MALTILGLSGALSHDPSAALYIDGKLIAAVEEERFVRDKHAKNRMPYEAARFCLQFAGIKPADVDAVAIKLGPSGAYYRDAHGEGLVPGVPVATVVDTVGAGDGFAVGVVSALLEGLPLPEAVARGNWIGSRAVQVRGDMEGLPKRSQLLDRERRRSA